MTRRNLIAAVILLMLLAGFFIWRGVRPPTWNARALTVAWSEASESFTFDPSAPKRDLKHAGFSLTYSLQNNMARDITIPADVMVMKRLTKGSTLADFSSVARQERSYFVPAGQRAEFSLKLDLGCTMYDVSSGVTKDRDSHACYSESLADSEGFVLFDQRQRIQVNLPKPTLK